MEATFTEERVYVGIIEEEEPQVPIMPTFRISEMPRILSLDIETDQEEDDRWIACIDALPGVMTYGTTLEEAIKRCKTLALELIADRIQHDELDYRITDIKFCTLI